MAEGESLSQHAAAASQKALEMAGVAAEEVDLIILATSSPDDLFGSACQVHSASRLVYTSRAQALSGCDYRYDLNCFVFEAGGCSVEAAVLYIALMPFQAGGVALVSGVA